ncbi:MAG TPA: M20/M25/M40 family metallo-hydrolase [Bryobacteraceae bacterium]|nr:M20/M25/M40 family metallo-hydrolase [Bryobacteraceae bacterium]
MIKPLTLAFLVAACWLSLRQVSPPPVVPASAPTTDFSAERALAHIRAFAREPHPVGSAAHDAVRDYIVRQFAALGVRPEIQKATVVSPRWGSPYNAATVENIVARLPGTDSTKAVMLSGHYDSVSAGPGASDDGHAVAAELETLRALRQGPRLRNDVIFLVTDSEEGGLLGAKGFLEHDPLIKQIGVVLNFEARGTSGPGMMFETSEGNGKLVREFAAAAPHPVTSSLSYEAYKLLPNDTDLTFYKQAGLAGLGFAYIDHVCYYHTQYDDVAHLDPRSLQQEGDYALSLTRRFGNIDLRDLGSPNATYFVLPFIGCVVYPASWSLPLAVFAALAFAAVVALGVAKRRLSAGGILASFAIFLAAIVLASAAVTGMWSLVKGQAAGFWQAFAGDPYHAGIYRLASVALTVALTGALYALLRKRARVLNLWAGALLCWLLLTVATSLFMPGASYLFLWPLLCCTAGLAIAMVRGGVLILWLSALPGIILMAPSIELLFMSLTMRMAFVGAFATVLLLGLLIPCLDLIADAGRWWLPAGAAAVCTVCLIAGASMSGFSRADPRTDSIYYGLDTDTGKAVWFSLDQHEDDWTAHYLGANPRRAALPQFVPFMAWQYLTHPAPAVSLPPPLIERVSESSDSASRTLRLRISSPRQAPRMYIYGDEHLRVLDATVDGTPIEAGKAYSGLKPGQRAYAYRMARWGLCYFNVPSQGIELQIRLQNPSASYRMEVVDQSYGIGGLPGAAPRPDSMIPFPLMMDSAWVRKSYLF